jgi:TetR/AcrR family fatty acid metabolism transcriptional regulator
MNERSFNLGEIMSNQRNKKDRILDAAVEVFAQKGYHIATMQDIATNANLAVGTIYNYFKNKDDLIVTLFNEKWEEYNTGIKELEQNTKESRDFFIKRLEYTFDFFRNNKNLILILFIQMSNLIFIQDRVTGLLELRQIIIDNIKEDIEENKELGLIDFDGDTVTMANIVYGSIQAFLTKTLILEGEIKEKDKSTFIKFITNGLNIKFQRGDK